MEGEFLLTWVLEEKRGASVLNNQISGQASLTSLTEQTFSLGHVLLKVFSQQFLQINKQMIFSTPGVLTNREAEWEMFFKQKYCPRLGKNQSS